MPAERAFIRYFTDVDLLDVALTLEKGRLLGFSLNYRAKIDGTWLEVVRYDTAHRRPLHIHRYWPPHHGKKDPLEQRPKGDYGVAFEEALRDLEDNWQRYRDLVERHTRKHQHQEEDA